MRKSPQQRLKDWEKFQKDIKKSTPREVGEAAHVRKARVDTLLNDPIEFMRYYFPQYASDDFADFHKRMVRYVCKHHEEKLELGWAIARDHAKTTVWQMFDIYLTLKRYYGENCTTLWVSKSFEAAVDMTRSIMLQFESNGRLINDFGELRSYGQWTAEKFVLKNGASWRALGKGQSPRGAKNEESRPKKIIIDDIDDDEEVLNSKRIDASHDWIWGALFGAFDIKGNHLLAFNNNIIAKDSLMSRALYGNPEGQNLKFKYSEVVNILNKKGKPSWNRYSLKDCNDMIKTMGTRLAEREYFNNPITEGKVFKQEWIQYKPMPRLSPYAVVLSYLDPSFKSGKHADHKGLALIGLYQSEIHIIKAWCDKASVAEMIEWHYELKDYLATRSTAADMYMEEVFLQSLLYKDFNEAGIAKGHSIPIRGDTRKKPDKDSRISALSGYFERGQVYFNELEKNNHHMQQLVEQFLLFEQGSTRVKKDGPDAVEGGIFLAHQKIRQAVPPITGKRKHSHRW
jgi:predicted phage terminase large subunit-like protein